ncbi:unnamed protein product, partial [Tetraodon nigroviridis]
QLTIIFKNFQECVEQEMYHAETDELPSAFADGSKNGGERHGTNALRVVEQVPGQHVVIQARCIGATIVVRQVGRHLTFAVRMPEEVVNSVEEGDDQDLYLCLHGCPANQRIDFRNFRARAAEAQGSGRSRVAAPRRRCRRTALPTSQPEPSARSGCRWRTCTFSPACSTCSPRATSTSPWRPTAPSRTLRCSTPTARGTTSNDRM